MTLFAWIAADPAGAAELPSTSHRIKGLVKDAEILIDRWGVPHIYAQTTYDVFFAQGFNVARDRLWQIDLWRKRGLGLLARDLGPAYVEQDRANRLFLFRGDMHAEWIAYSSDTKRIVENFVAGVNAYVELVRAQPELLPPEFKLLGYEPSLWQASDVVRIRSHGLVGNLASEVARANTVAIAGLEVDAFRRGLQPAWKTRVPEGLDPAQVPADVLRLHTLARAPVSFSPEMLQGRLPAQRTALDELLRGLEYRTTASNNFVVAPGRSKTGHAIFANDPHRVQGVPSLRYWAHLSAPGLEVVGAGEPFLPGVSLGHNRTIAFGLTVFFTDQEDLYVYATNPANPNEYRYGDRWEPMTVRTESIEVRGAPSQTLTLRFTRHGPVIYDDAAHHRAFAARVAWLEPGMAPYLSSLEYMRAHNWDEFLAAMNRSGLPSLNYLYADTSGNIGWAPSGLVPIRPAWDGLMPVPGDGRYEWDGFRSMDEFPRLFNPPAGWFGTSNEMNLPATPGLIEKKLGFEWGDPARSKRQRQIFGGTNTFSVEDVIHTQTDITTVTGQRITTLLAKITPPTEPRLAAAWQILRSWDHRVARDSAGATIYNVWYNLHVRPLVVQRVVPATVATLVGQGDSDVIINLLEKPDQRLGPDPVKARDEILLAAFRSAIAQLDREFGADPAKWQWGQIHQAYFEHPLASVRPSESRQAWDVGPISKAGDTQTIGLSVWRPGDYRLTAGASARFVTDVGDWNNSWACNTPGQSGDPRSPHYRDLFADWAHDRYFPLLFERDAVEESAEQRIQLIAVP